MTKFMIAKALKNEPMLFLNTALGEWMLTPREATKMHRLTAKELFDELREQGGIKILPVMVDRR